MTNAHTVRCSFDFRPQGLPLFFFTSTTGGDVYLSYVEVFKGVITQDELIEDGKRSSFFGCCIVVHTAAPCMRSQGSGVY